MFLRNKNRFILFLFRNNNLTNLIIILFFYLSLQYARNFLPIAQETHFLATQISNYLDSLDDASFIYSLLRTPAYDVLIDVIFDNQFLFLLFSYLTPLIICLSIYLFTLKITKSSIYSFYCTLLFLSVPIVVKFLLMIGIDDAYTKITFLYPRIDIWYRTFSVRQIHGIVFLISLIFLYKEKNFLLIVFTSLNLFIHPNSGLITLMILIVYFFLNSFLKKENIKILLTLLIILFFFSIYKILSLSSSIGWEYKLDSSEWYLNLVRDEADDFSIIYRLHNNTIIFLLTFIFYLLCIWLFIIKKYINLPSLLLIISIISLYLIFFIIEIMIFYFNQYYLAQIFLPLQPGWKTVGYVIFPLMILIYSFSKNFLNFKKIYFSILILVVSTTIFCIYYGNIRNFEKFKYYFSNLKHENVNYYDYIKLRYWEIDLARKVYNINNNKILKNVDFKNVFKKRKDEIVLSNNQKLFSEKFMQKFNSFKCIKELDSFNKLVPNHYGIIVPPYFIQLRDFFSKKNIFFQEHHDGNLSMGNLKVFSFFNKRMLELLNLDYKSLPPKTSGYQATFLRNIYLKLKEDDFIFIKKKYKKYDYLITENIHQIKKFDKLHGGVCFNLYEIK